MLRREPANHFIMSHTPNKAMVLYGHISRKRVVRTLGRIRTPGDAVFLVVPAVSYREAYPLGEVINESFEDRVERVVAAIRGYAPNDPTAQTLVTNGLAGAILRALHLDVAGRE